MRPRRSLALRRETLNELDHDALSGVVGAAGALPTEPVNVCVFSRLSPVVCGGPPGSTQCPEAQ